MGEPTDEEHLNQLLDWCRPRLSKQVYRETLDRYRREGPQERDKDEPRLVASYSTVTGYTEWS